MLYDARQDGHVAHRADLTLEREIQRDVVDLYGRVGCSVITFSQPRESFQTPGVPDLKVYCRRRRLTWWHEVKRPGGVQSAEQLLFQEQAEACGETYILGGPDAAIEQLRRVGMIANPCRT